MGIEYRVHWLSITIRVTFLTFDRIWNQKFSSIFGELVSLGHGGTGFRLIHEALGKVKVYSGPINVGKEDETFISAQFPGNACDALAPIMIHDFIKYLERNGHEFNFTRIDLALDNAPFNPEEFYQKIIEGKVRTYAKRDTFQFYSSPFQEQEKGEGIGCFTAQIGSSSSNRKLRVYNKRGFTRVELEVRKARADAIAKIILVQDPIYWGEQFIAHIRDFIDLIEDKDSGMLVKFWSEFVHAIPRAGLTITDPKEKEIEKLVNWLMGQVAPSLSVMFDIYGFDVHKALYEWGKKNRRDRFDAILPKMTEDIKSGITEK